jgi:hypothetical protein
VRRDQLEHAIRAACQIAGLTEVIIVGSQAILGTFTEDELPSMPQVVGNRHPAHSGRQRRNHPSRRGKLPVLQLHSRTSSCDRAGHAAQSHAYRPVGMVVVQVVHHPRLGPIKLRHIIRRRAAWSAVRSRERQVGLESNMCSNGLSAPARTLRAMFRRSSPQR